MAASALLTTESFTDIGFKSPSWIENNANNDSGENQDDKSENHDDESENHNSGDQVALVH